MSSNKRSLLRILLTANGGCGCGKPKPADVYEPSPKPKISIYDQNPKSSSLTSSTTSGADDNDGDFTSTTISEAETSTDHHNKSSKNNVDNIIPKQSPKLMDSVAIEKDSEDPYKDFRHSMLQMIFEKEIYSEDDLQELLQCFLQLNSPSQHEVICKAFTQICEEAFPKNKVSSGSCRNKKIYKNNGES